MWPFSSGSSSSSSSSQVPEPVAAAPPLNASTDSFTDPAQSAYPANPSAAPANDDTTSYLRSSQFTSTSPSGGYGDYTPTAADLLSSPAFDPARLHPLAGLGKDEVEYLDIVDNQPSTLQGARTALPSRGWSDDLCYGTGTTYLSGEHSLRCARSLPVLLTRHRNLSVSFCVALEKDLRSEVFSVYAKVLRAR